MMLTLAVAQRQIESAESKFESVARKRSRFFDSRFVYLYANDAQSRIQFPQAVKMFRAW